MNKTFKKLLSVLLILTFVLQNSVLIVPPLAQADEENPHIQASPIEISSNTSENNQDVPANLTEMT